jgi:hypothetical protein
MEHPAGGYRGLQKRVVFAQGRFVAREIASEGGAKTARFCKPRCRRLVCVLALG